MLKWIVGCLLLCGMVGSASYADTITGALNLKTGYNLNANATLTTSGGSSGTFSLAFNIVNSTSGIIDINSFSLQLFGAGAAESFSVASATLNGSPLGGVWEYFADDKLNNGSTPDCSTNSVKGWVCVDTGQGTLHPAPLGSGQTAAFLFLGSYSNTGAVSVLDMMGSGCVVQGTCKLDGGTTNDNKWAVSAPMTSPSPVPEPASLALLASGLLVVGTLLKRR
jgi:hypothetical protein